MVLFCQQKDHSVLADRFEPLIYSFAIQLYCIVVTENEDLSLVLIEFWAN
jgi:hypothetical protein